MQPRRSPPSDRNLPPSSRGQDDRSWGRISVAAPICPTSVPYEKKMNNHPRKKEGSITDFGSHGSIAACIFSREASSLHDDSSPSAGVYTSIAKSGSPPLLGMSGRGKTIKTWSYGRWERLGRRCPRRTKQTFCSVGGVEYHVQQKGCGTYEFLVVDIIECRICQYRVLWNGRATSDIC